jgi:hypothetical protein
MCYFFQIDDAVSDKSRRPGPNGKQAIPVFSWVRNLCFMRVGERVALSQPVREDNSRCIKVCTDDASAG